MLIEHHRLNVNDRYRFVVIVVIKRMVTIKKYWQRSSRQAMAVRGEIGIR